MQLTCRRSTERSVLSRIRIERLNNNFRPEIKNFIFEENKDSKILTGDRISIGIAVSF